MNLSQLNRILLLSSLIGTSAMATELEISIDNLTHGNHFTPVLLAAHGSDTHLFSVGEMASSSLQKMAEGGDIADLASLIEGANGITLSNPANGLMAPGQRVDAIMLDSQTMTHLSMVAMILPTNDAFVGLDAWAIPTTPGTYTIDLNGYDAGTEANDEVINGGGMPGVPGIPAAPGGNGGANATGISDMSSNDKVHIHPGVLGDTDLNGGMSDLDSRVHRWLNPVARIVVTVK